jgi:hypothetical protein
MTTSTWCTRAFVLSSRPSVATALAIAALAGTSCRAGEPPLVNPGVSDVRPELASARLAAPDAGSQWDRSAELPSYRAAAKSAFPSQGHFTGRWTAELLVNEPAATAYAALSKSTAMPQGAILVEKLRDQRTGAAGPLFAMEKRESGYFPGGGDWKFVVTDAAGKVQDEGQIRLCARCHAEGLADFLFDLPPDTRP